MRGKLDVIKKDTRIFGITPAGAGKTKTRAGFYKPHRDHPRRCGENSNRWTTHTLRRGSPPQVRGKLRARHRSIAPCRDHPRRCGENLSALSLMTACTGSPPQVRGKRGSRPHAAAHRRITPAGAGKTGMAAFANFWQKDHPRRCGENYVKNFMGYSTVGSPPQVRGKRRVILRFKPHFRITPAGAGKTSLYGL